MAAFLMPTTKEKKFLKLVRNPHNSPETVCRYYCDNRNDINLFKIDGNGNTIFHILATTDDESIADGLLRELEPHQALEVLEIKNAASRTAIDEATSAKALNILQVFSTFRPLKK